MSMRKKAIKAKADNVIELLKQGYSPKEITRRMQVSYNYAWKLKKDLEAAAKDTVETVRQTAAEHTDKVKEMIEDWRAEAEADNALDDILDERATTYGRFVDVSRMAQRLKNVAHTGAGEQGRAFAADQAEALDMIFSKIARILNGDPNHIDSWLDIAGYATLVADRLQGKTR